jgi:hypothetical protein
MPPPERFAGGAALQKELQSFVSFLAFQKTCFRNGTAMSQLVQQEAVAKEYFGNPDDADSVGLCAQLVEGTGIFAHLFDVEEKIQTADLLTASNNPRKASTSFTLKPHLHLIPNTKIIVSNHPRDINLALLHSSTLGGSNVIKAKALVTRAQEHIKNCKKALSVVTHARSPYKPYVTTGNLPSGMTLNDYYLFVRKKMFVLTDAAACISTRKKVNVQKGKCPALPALTAHVDSTVALTMKKSTTQSIDAGDPLALLAADEDGASATRGASFKSCNPKNTSATTSNNGHRELENSNPVAHDDVEVDDDPEGDKMPEDWTFPGFISFALLGPIVPPCMLPYRSEIMMPTLPPTIPGNTTNGRAVMRKERLVPKSCKNGVATSSSKEPAVSLQQKIMVAGIAQSQMLMEQRQKNRATDRAISFYQKKVTAQRMLLDQLKYMISVTPPDAPDRSELLGQLRVMNAALTNAVTECLNAEEAMLKEDVENDSKVVGGHHSKNFIDLTIATLLGGTAAEEDNCEIIAVTQERDSSVTASASVVSSNKKRRRKVNPPIQGWTMTHPAERLTEDVSPLSFENNSPKEDDGSH